MYSMQEKYERDPVFNMLVRQMESWIYQHDYSPSELREAAVMASINYESHRIRRVVYLDPKTEEALKTLRDVVEKNRSE